MSMSISIMKYYASTRRSRSSRESISNGIRTNHIKGQVERPITTPPRLRGSLAEPPVQHRHDEGERGRVDAVLELAMRQRV